MSTCFRQHRCLEPSDPQALSTAGPHRDVLSAKHTPDRRGCTRRMWNGSGIHPALLGYIGQNKVFHPFSKWLLENLKFPKWLASCFTAPSFILGRGNRVTELSCQPQCRPGSRLPPSAPGPGPHGSLAPHARLCAAAGADGEAPRSP